MSGFGLPFRSLGEHIFRENHSPEPRRIVKHILANPASILTASTLSWIWYLSIQTHVTTFQK